VTTVAEKVALFGVLGDYSRQWTRLKFARYADIKHELNDIKHELNEKMGVKPIHFLPLAIVTVAGTESPLPV